jgi:hypothetical protein
MLQECLDLAFNCLRQQEEMELPHQYRYDLRPWLILFALGSGLLWIAIAWLSLGYMPSGFSLWFGLVPVALAFIVGVRRISVAHYLLLDNDTMVLPTRPFQMRTAKVEYTSIKRVWRHYLPMTVVLRVATENRTFEILSTLLPDNESYRAVEEFLVQKALENTRADKSSKS